jgi:hypothetical protein
MGPWKSCAEDQPTMNKAPTQPDDDEMREEYDFSAGVRGKYAQRYAAGRMGLSSIPTP